MTDEELGKECGRRWDAACKGMRIDLLVSWQRQKLGAMVRLIRQADPQIRASLIRHAANENQKAYEVAFAWLSEARGLVGEEEVG